MKPYYDICKGCGANLDPGEQCTDCKEKADQDGNPETAEN